jgi:hypothetical protein
MLSVFAGTWPLITAHWIPSVRTIKITNTTVRKLVFVLAPGSTLPNVVSGAQRSGKSAAKRLANVPGSGSAVARRGRSATKPAAIAPGFSGVDDLPGTAMINEASLAVAMFPGAPANLAASRQGSRSDRASADRTLSGIPFVSSPTDAYRKLSNSDVRLEFEEDAIVPTIKFRRLTEDMAPTTKREAMLPCPLHRAYGH